MFLTYLVMGQILPELNYPESRHRNAYLSRKFLRCAPYTDHTIHFICAVAEFHAIVIGSLVLGTDSNRHTICHTDIIQRGGGIYRHSKAVIHFHIEERVLIKSPAITW